MAIERSKLSEDARKRAKRGIYFLARTFGEMELPPNTATNDSGKTVVTVSAAERKAQAYENWVNALGRYTEESILTACREVVETRRQDKWPAVGVVSETLKRVGTFHDEYKKANEATAAADEYSKSKWPASLRSRVAEIVNKAIDAEFEAVEGNTTFCKLGVDVTAKESTTPEQFKNQAIATIRTLENLRGGFAPHQDSIDAAKRALKRLAAELPFGEVKQ